MSWKVEWENDIDNADGPTEAAYMCRNDIINGESLMFTVTDYETGQRYSVDLNESEGEEAIEIND